MGAVETKGAIKQKRRNNFVSHMRHGDAYFFQTICNLPIVYCGVTIKQTITDVQEWNVPLFHVQRTAHADNPPVYTYMHGRPLVFTPRLIRVFGYTGFCHLYLLKALSFIFSLRCMLVCLWLNII